MLNAYDEIKCNIMKKMCRITITSRGDMRADLHPLASPARTLWNHKSSHGPNHLAHTQPAHGKRIPMYHAGAHPTRPPKHSGCICPPPSVEKKTLGPKQAIRKTLFRVPKTFRKPNFQKHSKNTKNTKKTLFFSKNLVLFQKALFF